MVLSTRKRKRDSDSAIPSDDGVAVVLEALESYGKIATRILDAAGPKGATLRRDVRTGTITKIERLDDRTDAAAIIVLKRATREDALKIAAFRKFAHELIAREIERAPSDDNEDAGEVKQENEPPQQTTDLSLVPNVSRPVGSKALFANTPLGPMFTSAVASEVLIGRSLPAEYLSLDVLPQIPTSTSLLVSAKAPARYMNLGRKNPLVAVADSVAAVKQPISDAALAHGLSKDTSEAQSGSRQTLFPIVNHILARRAADTKPIAMQETDSGKDTEMQDAKVDVLMDIDEDLINAFEGVTSPEASTTDAKSRSPSISSGGAGGKDRDPTATLQRLAQLQADRMRDSATKQPTDEEIKCAKAVQDALSKQILAAGLTPAELLGEGGVRSDYTFVRLGQSYQGTLPSTLNQAVASSQDFMMRLPRMHPLQAAIVPISPTWASMGAQSSANGTLEQVPVSQQENYAAEPGRHGSVPNLGAFHHPSIASQLLGLAAMTSSRPSAPPSSRGPMPPTGMPNGSYPGTPAGPMGAPPMMMTPAGYNSPYAYPPPPPHAVNAAPPGMSPNPSSSGSAAPKNYPPPILATVPGKSKPIKLGPTGKRYYTPRKPNPAKLPGATPATPGSGSAGSATPPPPKLGPDGQPRRGPGRPRKDASAATPGSTPATPAAPIVPPAPPK